MFGPKLKKNCINVNKVTNKPIEVFFIGSYANPNMANKIVRDIKPTS